MALLSLQRMDSGVRSVISVFDWKPFRFQDPALRGLSSLAQLSSISCLRRHKLKIQPPRSFSCLKCRFGLGHKSILLVTRVMRPLICATLDRSSKKLIDEMSRSLDFLNNFVELNSYCISSEFFQHGQLVIEMRSPTGPETES